MGHPSMDRLGTFLCPSPRGRLSMIGLAILNPSSFFAGPRLVKRGCDKNVAPPSLSEDYSNDGIIIIMIITIFDYCGSE